jgi:hypothetical protein
LASAAQTIFGFQIFRSWCRRTPLLSNWEPPPALDFFTVSWAQSVVKSIMPRHRKRRRSQHIAKRRRKRALFAGASFVMLIAELLVIVPQARRQNISWRGSIELALLLWGCSVFAVWACLRARRKHRSREHRQHAEGTDYSDVLEEEYSRQTVPRNEPPAA